MDQHALEHYQSYSENVPHAHYHRVIALHEEPTIDWDEVSKLAPVLCHSWYELARLPVQDRLEFVREFWCSKFRSQPDFVTFTTNFFDSLDDLGIFLTQQCYDSPFEISLVYSLNDDEGFFHGKPPITEDEIIALQKVFPNYILPVDYVDFLSIHNGFAKQTDTGIRPSRDMQQSYQDLQMVLEKGEPLRTTSGVTINPKSLIPFYKSFDTPFFQCFYGDWYPDKEMGNVFYSGISHTISDFTKQDNNLETMAFNTFTDWLKFYLEKID